jgi:hypothetical protein
MFCLGLCSDNIDAVVISSAAAEVNVRSCIRGIENSNCITN